MEKIILLVEDFDDLRYVMKMILESYDYKVIEALDGVEAVEMVKLHSPDLVLMDLSLPQMDGLTAAETIRSLDFGTDIPIIAVTAYAKHFNEKVIEAGCKDVIEKPVNFNLLISMIDKYL